VPGTATSADYTATAGTVTIPAGADGGTIPAEIVADALDEPTERFTIAVDSVTGANIDDGSATVKIHDDDAEPALVVGDAQVHEGDGTASIGVMLSAPSGRDVTVEFRTHHHSARSGSDFVRSRGSVTIRAGHLGTTIRIPIVDDAVHEGTETFRVELDDADHAELDHGQRHPRSSTVLGQRLAAGRDRATALGQPGGTSPVAARTRVIVASAISAARAAPTASWRASSQDRRPVPRSARGWGAKLDHRIGDRGLEGAVTRGAVFGFESAPVGRRTESNESRFDTRAWPRRRNAPRCRSR